MAESPGIGGNLPKSEEFQTECIHRLNDTSTGLFPFLKLARKEDHAHGIRGRELDSRLPCLITKKSARDGSQQTRTISAGAVGIDATTVGETLERGQRTLDDLPGFAPAELGNKAHTTSVVIP